MKKRSEASHDRLPSGDDPVDMARHLDRMLLARYAPPGVLVNDKMQILEFRGDTGSFLQARRAIPSTASPRWRVLDCCLRSAQWSRRA